MSQGRVWLKEEDYLQRRRIRRGKLGGALCGPDHFQPRHMRKVTLVEGRDRASVL